MLLAVCGWAVGSAWGQHPVVQQATAVPVKGPGEPEGPSCAPDPRVCDPNDPDPDNVLELVVAGGTECVRPGEQIIIELRQRNLRELVRGYQAFLCYDPSCLTITCADITFTADPYGIPIFCNVDPVNGVIELAAGINDNTQDPTMADALLATLVFSTSGECSSEVFFRDNQPPTRFTGETGFEVTPCVKNSGKLCVDGTPPVITCPPDWTGECDGASDPNVSGRATATDNCSDPNEIIVTFEDEFFPDPNCPQAGTIHRRWTATDCSGNSTDPNVCIQVIRIVDTTPPMIECPPDVELECDKPTDPNHTGFATATDNCADPNDIVITWNDVFVPDPNCPNPRVGRIQRTWTATDPCGNSSECVQTITLIDTTDPVIVCPPDVTVECDQPTDPNHTGWATATDNCTDPNGILITYEDRFISDPNCPNGGVIERTWTATDPCGNASSCLQQIAIVDTTPPVIECPPDVVQECDEPTDPNHTGRATATDNCNPVVVPEPNDVIIPGDCPQSYTIRRTWKADDGCGNVSTCVQTITVVDTTPPEITCPPDVTVECDKPTDPNATGRPTATDNCADPNEITFTYEDEFTPDPNCPNGGVIVRTWTATDPCGNSSSCEQQIRVVDTTPPVIECPPDVIVECDKPTDPNHTGRPTAADNCTPRNDIVITYEDTITPDNTCPNGRTITREWWADDGCGNTSHCVQTITVVDTTPPEITCPPDVTVECGEPTDPNALGRATATDNCTDPNEIVITWQDTVTPDPNCPKGQTISREWWADDGCGNTAHCTQTIRVVDTTPPVITCPPDVTVECGEPTDPNHTGRPTATDNCTDPNGIEITFRDTFDPDPGCPQTGVITREWWADDGCGNTAHCTQTITVFDTTPPEIVGDCSAIKVVPDAGQCEASVTLEPPEAVDNCDPNVSVTGVRSDGRPLNDPFPVGHTTVTWVAKDDCGNATQCDQVVQVADFNLMAVRVKISDPGSGWCSRCIHLEMFDGPTMVASADQVVTLSVVENDPNDPGLPAHYSGRMEVAVPCGLNITCVTAQDPLHTTRSTATVDPNFVDTDGVRKYRAQFRGMRADRRDASDTGHWLIQGNYFGPISDPADQFIDILDFGAWSSEFDRHATYPNGGSTTCEARDPNEFHADGDCDGVADFDDDLFRVINNFLAVYEDGCGGMRSGEGGGRGPILDISVQELIKRGWGKLAAGDWNHDGRLNTDDIAAFFETHGGGPTGASPPCPSVERPRAEASASIGEADAPEWERGR